MCTFSLAVFFVRPLLHKNTTFWFLKSLNKVLLHVPSVGIRVVGSCVRVCVGYVVVCDHLMLRGSCYCVSVQLIVNSV